MLTAMLNSIAFFAQSVTFACSASVLIIVLVAMWTMSLSGVILPRVSATKIDSISYRLKVSRIYTRRDPTQMVKNQTVWNRANQQFISDSVSGPLETRCAPSLNRDLSIARSCYSARPQPTTAVRLWQNIVHQTLKQWSSHGLEYSADCAMVV